MLLVFICGYWYLTNHPQSPTQTSYTHISVGFGGLLLDTRIADTDALREQGLSGTASLSGEEAMLFIFDRPDTYSFWMKDMQYPIDIIWLDSAKRIVFIKPHAEPASYPEAFKPNVPALYVIEVTDGFAERHHLQIGDQAQF